MADWKNKDPIALVRACQRGDAQAQAVFYDLHKRRLLGICSRYARTTFEAEDIFQEAFIRVFQRMGEIRQPEAVNGWIKSVVIRSAIDYYRRNRLFDEGLDDSRQDEFAHTRTDDFDILNELARKEILDVIISLPTGYRLVLNLYLVDGYEHHEIAGMLGIAIGTSKSQLHRAKSLIRQKLNALGIMKYERR